MKTENFRTGIYDFNVNEVANYSNFIFGGLVANRPADFNINNAPATVRGAFYGRITNLSIFLAGAGAISFWTQYKPIIIEIINAMAYDTAGYSVGLVRDGTEYLFGNTTQTYKALNKFKGQFDAGTPRDQIIASINATNITG